MKSALNSLDKATRQALSYVKQIELLAPVLPLAERQQRPTGLVPLGLFFRPCYAGLTEVIGSWPGCTTMGTDSAEDPQLVYDTHVFCCVNERPSTHRRGCCASKGALELANYMCRLAMVKANGLSIRVNLAGCLNACEHGPAMVIYPEGVWYRFENHGDIDEILSQHVLRGKRVERLALHLDPSKMHR
ncbi:hypothetical protein [uncultured Variovorax sp.]|uniref:(2Fe-2S) ferredoxin domain-containing protein n=1 Tax=uncultured Variovorax sp. TaxID=114708 RepID=UPI00261C6656|nr:hypothetical protein [uncultured Variovorax sp.]